MKVRSPRPGPQRLVAYLKALIGQAPTGQLIELRYRRAGGGMGQRFFCVRRPDAAAAAIAVLGRRDDVYVGVAPRTRREGTRAAVADGWALWAECDGEAAAATLAAFEPAPAIIVSSGSGENRHAYWPLLKPLPPGELEHANRRLARAVGADEVAHDAARILRPPGSLNFKHDPPTPVALERFTGERFEPARLLAALPALAPTPTRSAPAVAIDADEDPLRQLEPAVYVRALTGREPGRDRKLCCPLHPDRTPSFHVYKTPEDGWYCFGCGAGGSVYDLGAALLGLSTRGPQFLELRHRLYELLLPGRDKPDPRERHGDAPAARSR